jgi:hypothetical protein
MTTTATTDHVQNPEVLQRGDTGQEVYLLQSLLKIQVDGVFGPQTEVAVRRFQQAKGLEVDGIVGEKTREALMELVPNTPSTPPTPPTRVTDPVQLRGLQAAARLASLKGQGKYGLGAGGTNPNSATPFGWWNGLYACDCIGAVCWAFGIPRKMASFPEYGGDINVDSMMMDARAIEGYDKGEQRFFKVIPKELVRPGSIVCFPSVTAGELGVEKDNPRWTKSTRLRVGHVGIVCGWKGLADVGDPHATPWSGDIAELTVVECSGGNPAVKFGLDQNFHAHDERREYTYGEKSFREERWRTQFVEFHYGL